MRNKGCSRRDSSAFTLVELIITIAIAAILAAIAMPSYTEFSVRMTVSENTNALVGALSLARSEAVKRGRPVAVIANGDDWSKGWQVVAGKSIADGTIADPVTPGAAASNCKAYVDIDTATTPLCPLFHDALQAGYTITGKATGTGAVDTKIVYGPAGNLVGKATGFDFSVCRPTSNADIKQSRWVTVSASGSVTSRPDVTSSPAGTCS